MKQMYSWEEYVANLCMDPKTFGINISSEPSYEPQLSSIDFKTVWMAIMKPMDWVEYNRTLLCQGCKSNIHIYCSYYHTRNSYIVACTLNIFTDHVLFLGK